MSKKRVSCGLDLGFDGDLKASIEGACSEGYDFVCVDLVDPKQRTPFLKCSAGHRTGDASEPDFMLRSQEWSTLVVGKMSQWISFSGSDLDKATDEGSAHEELNFAAYLSLPAMLVHLQNEDCASLAKLVYTHLLRSHHNLTMWVCVPLTHTDGECNGNTEKSVSPWRWWNKFRVLCNYHNRVGVALQITADLPDQAEIAQWLGEPIKVVVLHTSVFLCNRKGYPVLSRAHQSLMVQFFKLNCQVLITGNYSHHDGVRVYQQYIAHLYENQPPPDQYEIFSKGYEDYLQSPLQPLMDNLESATYEVFEKDPVKYVKYREAICECLIDRVPERDADTTVTVVMVLGAGRGPLVRAALQAAQNAKRKIKCYAVEKNASASVTLQLLKRTEWANDDVTIVSSDMRVWNAPELADIIISELLGSFGDNELSPECLDGAERFLKTDAISIPSSYTSYLSPASSQKLFNEVTAASALDRDKPKETAFETPYVVRIHNYNELATAKPVFTFKHPSFSGKDKEENVINTENLNEGTKLHQLRNARHVELSFDISSDTVLHGLAGYFYCSLYKDICISIVPESHSPGMFSWFPLFFPLLNPIQVNNGGKVIVNIWRCCLGQKVWYEWAITEPCISPIHNPGGRSYTIGL
ncbi:unnamed protein product [Clavelina lepadiformis]|uniref:Protein arginine N-methyltransferase n=1 Tax=Clavelina lepadiformis TaxID=159417 RepID=A0ABP0FBM0_CLALP